MLITLKAIVIVGSLLSGSLDAAMAKASECGTATSWAEQAAPGVWVAACGDEHGNEVNSCEARAELMFELASSAGQDGDAAYEDAIAACRGE